MTEAEYIQELENRKAALEQTNAGIELQIEELEAQQTANEEDIENIDKLLLYIAAGYPTIDQLATPASFTGTATAVAGVYSTVLNWDDVATATGYVLQRGLLADYSDAEEIYSNSTSAYDDEDEDLTYNRDYYYRVKATADGKADSEWATVTVNMFEQLAEATNPALDPGDTIIDLTFDPVQFALTYDIYRHTANDFSGSTKVGADIVVTTFNDSGLLNDTGYYYWIVAKSPSRLNSDPKYAGNAVPNP